MIRGIGSVIRGFWGRSSKVAESVAANTTIGTTVRTDLATGTTFMERAFKGKLYKVEERVLPNGAKQTTTRVYCSNGDYIGKGGDEGLSVFRETQVSRQNGGSILGGDRVEINKQYHETMGMTAHTQNVTKDFDSRGVLQHMEGTLKYSHWENPRTASMDRTFAEVPLPHSAEILFNPKAAAHTNYKHSVSDIWANGIHYNGYSNHGKFATEGTTYSRAIDAQKAAEQAKIAEAEAAKAAALRAEQEAAAKLTASRPRVNTGKVLNRNIEELKCIEETRPDGSIVRRYFDPMHYANGKSNPMITTIDRGSYHEELIYDPIKGVKISYKQLGNGEPEIEMTRGLQYRYTSKMVPDRYNNGALYRVDKQVYDDGLSHVEFSDQYPGAFNVHIKNQNNPQMIKQYPDSYGGEYINVKGRGSVGTYSLYSGPSKNETLAQNRLDEITAEANKNQIDLMDLFKPYQA